MLICWSERIVIFAMTVFTVVPDESSARYFSRSELLAVRPSSYKLDSETFNCIVNLGILKRKRGCRAGNNNLRTIHTIHQNLFNFHVNQVDSQLKYSQPCGNVYCHRYLRHIETISSVKDTVPINKVSDSVLNPYAEQFFPAATYKIITKEQNLFNIHVSQMDSQLKYSQPRVNVYRHRCLRRIETISSVKDTAAVSVSPIQSTIAESGVFSQPPVIMLVNPWSLCKSSAIQQLTVDVQSYGADVVIISESWLKKRHTDDLFRIDGYNLYRRDRLGRGGGGVAIYLVNSVISSQYNFIRNDARFEVLIVRCKILSRHCFILGVYNPPHQQYPISQLLEYIEDIIDTLSSDYPDVLILLAGDLNHLPGASLQSLGLIEVPIGATRSGNSLDRLYTSEFMYGSNVKKVKSLISKADHLVVIVRADSSKIVDLSKIITRTPIRIRTPSRHSQLESALSKTNWSLVTNDFNPETAFQSFQDILIKLLDKIYPFQLAPISSRDTYFYTPYLKCLLRKKNRLSRKGRLEEADALSNRIGRLIADYTSKWLGNQTTDAIGSRYMWRQIKVVQGRENARSSYAVDLTSEDLNRHYANVSTDTSYIPPERKETVCKFEEYLTEAYAFRLLSKLRDTASGPDNLPSWFLRIAAPFIAAPFAYIANLLLSFSYVPLEWKSATITPVPKIQPPTHPSEFRPISVTSVLSRLVEKAIVRKFIYPTFDSPLLPPQLSFQDQYAFRPTGSTTSALIAILQSATEMLNDSPYVHLISLDMSKAFDSVRTYTLFNKLSLLPIPDSIYNWLLSFFTSRSHCTKYKGILSSAMPINASIVQGSGLGPSAYDVCSSDLKPKLPACKLHKFADDLTLLVPASHSTEVSSELRHVENWACDNNLKLNLGKSSEIIVFRKGTKPVPTAELPSLKRVVSAKILGVIIDQNLGFHTHTDFVVAKGAQSLFGLKVLKAHGLSHPHLSRVTRSSLINRVLYASQAWLGFLSVSDLDRLRGLVRKAIRWGLYRSTDPSFQDIVNLSDRRLFGSIKRNQSHVLASILPLVKNRSHNLRKRSHDYTLSVSSTLFRRNFIQRMLFADAY